MVQDLKEMGIENAMMDELGYVYAFIPSNTEKICNTIGFIALQHRGPP